MMYDVSKLPVEDLKGINIEYVTAPTFIRDGILYLNCETEVFVADYYNEFGIEILDIVVEWAEANGGHWEWVNPGCLMFCK